MKKFTLYHVSEGTLFESSDTQPGQQFYLATEADEVMAGASIALNNAKARIRELERALGNCRLLAMKRLHKGAIEKADWENILRFCTEAGCGPSPLRADS